MERRGILINNGFVVNIVVWADHSAEQFANDGYDQAFETTDLDQQPGIGWTWNETDGFRPPTPFQSWAWSEVDGCWVAPYPMPTDGSAYIWDESTTSWTIVPDEE